MIKEESIALAKEAGAHEWCEGWFLFNTDDFDKYYQLMLNAERKSLRDSASKAARTAIRSAVKQEREECAQICDAAEEAFKTEVAAMCAADIRARNNE